MTSNEIVSLFPDQVKLGFSQKIPTFSFDIKDIGDIIVCGMGGSALAAEFLKRFYPIRIHRNYDLPEQLLTDKTLIICLSYSGNTEEVISAYDTAINKKLSLIVISSGGELLKKASSDNIPFIEVQSKGIEPRMSVVEQICILKNLFSSLSEIKSIFPDDFSIDKKNINPEKLLHSANEISNSLINKTPVIYASANNAAMAIYWKAMFNENAKVPSFWNVFPELNHNELMQGIGIDWPEKLHFINLLDEDDHPRIQKRMSLTSDIFKKKGFGVDTIKIEGLTSLEKIVNSITLGNLVSISLAEKLKIDPIDPDIREEFKRKMKE
jgi:glucose/mannose-6-phosphate isomerase